MDVFHPTVEESLELVRKPNSKENGVEFIRVAGKNIELNPEAFKLIVPNVGLKEYDFHKYGVVKSLYQ